MMYEEERAGEVTASDAAYQMALDRIYAVAGEKDWSVGDRILLQVHIAADTTIEEFFPGESPELKAFDKNMLTYDMLKRLQQDGELDEADSITPFYSGPSNRWLEYIDSGGSIYTIGARSLSSSAIHPIDTNRRRDDYENLRARSRLSRSDQWNLARLNREKQPRRVIPRKQLGDWGRTAMAVGHLRRSDPRYEEVYDEKNTYGRFAGRPVIGRDTPINGGVYVGLPNGNREAIVVDDQKHPAALNHVYNKAVQRIYKFADESLDWARPLGYEYGVADKVLRPVFNTVLDVMPYSDEVVNDIVRGHAKDTKVSLNAFINRGGGVCRHQALLVAYTLERLQKNGELSDVDRISVDRNSKKGELGGHAWVRYTSSDGTVYIIDPAQRFVGTLEEAESRYSTWPYARPEDYR